MTTKVVLIAHYKSKRILRAVSAIIMVWGYWFFAATFNLCAQSSNPSLDKSKVELILDLQSVESPEVVKKAVATAIQQRNLDVLTIGMSSERWYVRKLCLVGLDALPDDQQKLALSSCLRSNNGWRPSLSGQIGSFQLQVNEMMAARLQRFGITAKGYELWNPAIRQAVAQRLQATGTK